MPAYSRILLPWDSQPQENTPVALSDALSVGLSFVWNAANPTIDALSGASVSPVNAPTESVNKWGRNRKFVRASSQYYDAGTGPNVTFAGDMTVLVAYTLDAAPAATNTGMMLFARDHSSGGRSFAFDIFRKDADVPTTGVRFYTNGGGTPGTNVISEGRAPVAGDTRIAVAVWSPSTNTSQIWIDGVLVASNTAATNPPAATTSARIAGRTYTGFTDYLTGQIPIVLAWNRRLGAAEVQDVSGNPWQIFAPRSIWVPVSAGGAPTLALTGYAATGSAGILVPALSLAVAGNGATAAQGTATPSLSLATTGNTATSSAGTPVASISLALTGNAATASVGTVGIGGTTQALTGNAATTSAGTPVAAISLALTGNGVTSSVGTATPALSKAITGNAATTSAGTPTASLSLAITGNAATASAGTVAVPGVIVPSSSVATTAAGTVTPGISIALTGNGATASVGSVSPAISLALSGLAGTSSAGIVIPGLSLALSGNAAAAATGTIAVATGNATVALTGNLATAYAGSLGIGGAAGASEWWRYDVPVNDMRYAVPVHNLRYDVDTENLT